MIDLHCDTITECHRCGAGLRNDKLQYSLDRIPDSVRLCQAMAVFIPDDLRGEAAMEYFQSVYRLFCGEMELHRSRVARVLEGNRIDDALESCPAAAMLTVEGGAVLGGDIRGLTTLYQAGVKMMTLTWNGANEICGGCASGEGFTPFGRRVVARMERLGMAVDVSHLSDRGFWELCEFASRPFAASHSNARSVCGNSRNLTDDMFREIVRRGGVAGLNYYTNFIATGGKTRRIEDLLRHLFHFLELGGEDAVALGSDFDGAEMPEYLSGVEKLGALHEALDKAGIPERVVKKLFYDNARRYFAALEAGRADGEDDGKDRVPPQ